jgi:type I restriction-modification system DNA methylase subunit
MARRSPEHTAVRLPLVEQLVGIGWERPQLQYSPEWRVPKTPSEASNREAGLRYEGYPVDVAIFDTPQNVGKYEHLVILVETKAPEKTAGINQLKIYLSLEPHVRLGVWTNGSDTAFVFRAADGSFVIKRNGMLPRPTDTLVLEGAKKLVLDDLQPVSTATLRRVFKNLLEVVVARDTKSTRRDDQLNHLCNLLLTKLESDKNAKLAPDEPVAFQVWGSEAETSKRIQSLFESMRLTHSDLFGADTDRHISLDEHTFSRAAYELGALKLIDVSIQVISEAFQVFRSASVKADDGQYFTPYTVIRSAVRFMEIHTTDKVIDPACGTGGFLLESYTQLRERYPAMSDGDAKGWAQRHLYGIDKDRINVKLTKAIMLIVGDGSTHTYLGDSLRSHLWPKRYPELVTAAVNESFTCAITNPPFGKNLKLSAADSERSGMTMSLRPDDRQDRSTAFSIALHEERELGLMFLERCYRLLVTGGRLGIILPETYMFSPSYAWLQSWMRHRFLIRGILNIPMEAFQGFCRAKTNFYVFEKIRRSDLHAV